MKAKKTKQIKARREEIKRRLKLELKKEFKPLFMGTLAMIGSATANQAIPKLLGKVLDQNASSSCPAKSGMFSPGNPLLLVILGGGISSFLRTTMLNRAQDSISARLRMQVFAKLMKRNIEWYQTRTARATAAVAGEEESANKEVVEDDGIKNSPETKTETETETKTKTKTIPSAAGSGKSPSEIQSILADDVNDVAETITTTIANTIRSTCSVIFATRNMLHIDPHLLSISVGVVPIIGSAAVILNKFVKKNVQKQRDLSLQAESFASERIEHVSTVKISNREEDEIDTYVTLQGKVVQLGKMASWAKGVFMGFTFSATSAALVMIFHAGGKDVAKGVLTHGELKSFATYTFMLGLGTSGVMKGLGKIAQGLICAERVYDLLDDDDDTTTVGDEMKTSVVEESSDVKNTPEASDISGICVSNVSFSYASSSSENTTTALKNVSLEVERGQVVALVGGNGAGKSTLAKLLVALHQPQSGSIIAKTTNGEEIDMKSLDSKTTSQIVQLVPQQPVLFDMSIAENVTYTNPTAPEEDISRALDAANCNGFIAKLEDGLKYNVGRNGSKLSGGQRQRLALARALLSDPSLLILDEPTSSMDAEGDNAVADAVQACRDGSDSSGDMDGNGARRGLLLITHRASSLKLADRIVVLKDGEVVEEGSYDDLKENKESALCQLMPDLQ